MHVVRALYDGVRVLCGVATGPCEVTRGRYDVTQVRSDDDAARAR
jgi:hypothetical protein